MRSETVVRGNPVWDAKAEDTEIEALAVLFCAASGWPADDPVLYEVATREMRRRKSALEGLLAAGLLPSLADPGIEGDRRAQDLVRTGVGYGEAVRRVLSADVILRDRYLSGRR